MVQIIPIRDVLEKINEHTLNFISHMVQIILARFFVLVYCYWQDFISHMVQIILLY